MATFLRARCPHPFAFLLLAGLLAAPAAAQNGADEDELFFGDADVEDPFAETVPTTSNLRVTGNAGVGYQFSGGEFDAWSAGASISFQTQLERDLSLSVSIGYRVTDYNFKSDSKLGIDPWGEVQTLGGGVHLRWDIADDWTIFGGPVFEVAREEDADWSDAFIGGGFLGASVQMSEDLVIGAGFGVVSQLDDDARFVPILVLDWRIANDVRLANARPGGAMETPGLEVIWEPEGDWEFAAGFGFRYRRFRLDDRGSAPAGVGEDTAIPLTLRASYRPNANFDVSAIIGVIAEGSVQLENDEGGDIAEKNYDLAGYVSLRGTIRF